MKKEKDSVKKKTVYYAHAMCIYGHDVERDEVDVIKHKLPGAKILNPAAYSNHPEKRSDTMGFCLRLVEGSDAVVFSRLLGKVTAGVGKEVNHGLRLRKPVFEIVGQKLTKRTRPVKYVNRDTTINLYREWRYSEANKIA
jgi:hypothetical protein